VAKQPTILIRADASHAIGTGHVMRCLALAQAWLDAGGQASLVASELPDSLADRLKASGVSVTHSTASPGSCDDARNLAAHGSQIDAEWMVIDGDRFGCDFLEAIRSAGFRILLIDDFANRPSFPADIIVNPNFGADPKKYRRCDSRVQLLTGPSYALLRREFQRHFNRCVREPGHRILISMGGSDPENMAPRIVAAISDCSDLQVTGVAGSAYTDKKNLLQKTIPAVRWVFDAQEMAGLMVESDIAITAAGGTLWELLCTGCAVLSFSRDAGGADILERLAKRGVVVNLGNVSGFDPVMLCSAVRELASSVSEREHMAKEGQALVDGLGAKRVMDAVKRANAGTI
jgi:UDP-2,4-diacetamido-2,4,6-trideoxy-beta-L-altropyranose hydrolase